MASQNNVTNLIKKRNNDYIDSSEFQNKPSTSADTAGDPVVALENVQPTLKSVELTKYEKKQSYNAVTSWLHSFRYRHMVQIFTKISNELNRPVKVYEIGAGSGKLFSILDQQFDIDYYGVEMRSERVDVAKERYQDCANFSIVCGLAEEHIDAIVDCDVIVALETLEHIPENIVVRLVEKIAVIRPKAFICSVPVEVGPMIWVKNVGSLLMGYRVRYQGYTWPETFWAGLYKLDRLRPHLDSHRGFDWRWLAQTIRHNLRIVEIRSLPLRFMPPTLSPTVMFIAEPRQT